MAVLVKGLLVLKERSLSVGSLGQGTNSHMGTICAQKFRFAFWVHIYMHQIMLNKLGLDAPVKSGA